MEDTINLEQLSWNIIQTTETLLALEQSVFDINEEDFVFIDDVESLHHTKQLFVLRIAKPLYNSAVHTMVFDKKFQRAVNRNLRPT